MRRVFLIGVAVACGGESPPMSPSPEPSHEVGSAGVHDAALPPIVPAPPGPDPQCTFSGALETLELRTDLATMTGTLTRSSPGANHYRSIRYTLARDTDTSFDLVFLGYNPDDYPPIRNFHGASAPRERMVVGKSIVAHLAVVGNLTRIQDREVDLHSNMTYQTRDHSYPCALIDDTFYRAHPTEFLPR